MAWQARVAIWGMIGFTVFSFMMAWHYRNAPMNEITAEEATPIFAVPEKVARQ